MIYTNTDVLPENMAGGKDGYDYSLMQLNASTLTYKMTNPDGAMKVVEVDEAGMHQLCEDPQSVWFGGRH